MTGIAAGGTAASSSSSSSTTSRSLWKKTALCAVTATLIAALSSSSDSNNDKEDAAAAASASSFTVFTALQQHEPSLRIFRSLLEIDLGLFCLAVSLHLWCTATGRDWIARLLFRVDEPAEDGDNDVVNMMTLSPQSLVLAAGSDHEYRNVVQGDDDDVDDDENDNDKQSCKKKHKDDKYYNEDEVFGMGSEALDAVAPDSDGEGSVDAEQQVDAAAEHYAHTDVTAAVPTPAAVTGAALDLLLIILVSLFLYTFSASAYSSESNGWLRPVSRIAAPAFALLLFAYCAAWSVLPWKCSRSHFWRVVAYTAAAPAYPVTFRDGFIGDILTSSVRPMQDISFTVCYMLFGLKGWWSDEYFNNSSNDSNDAVAAGGSDSAAAGASADIGSNFLRTADHAVPAMEKSWILHTAVLPMCMVSPLWWRFCQNLRQCWTAKRRWPYLGNALKYFCAAQVAMTGLFFPASQRSSLWLCSFVAATAYQIWWDVFMDWELLARDDNSNKNNRQWRSLQLRKERLYGNTAMYWTIFWLNIVLRFGWTLSFLPARYLDATGVLTNTFGNLNNVVTATIGSAEIVRRTMWGWLRYEWEAIKTAKCDGTVVSPVDNVGQSRNEATQGKHSSSSSSSTSAMNNKTPDDDDPDDGNDSDRRGLEMTPMKVTSQQDDDSNNNNNAATAAVSSSSIMDDDLSRGNWQKLGRGGDYSKLLQLCANDMSNQSAVQIAGELTVYAVAFAALGLVAAFHRGTL